MKLERYVINLCNMKGLKLNLELINICRVTKYSTQAVAEKGRDHDRVMVAWQLNSYGDETKLELSNTVPIPKIKNSNQVLVKVVSTSINPLDVEMISGFGSVLLKNMRQLSSFYSDKTPDLPLILGRDFSGEIVEKGSHVSKFNVGDDVYGVVKPKDQGCHCRYVLTEDYLVAKKPNFLMMDEVSGIMYTGITAWCALKISGGLALGNTKNKRVLVIGSSGGVGIIAVQMLNAWGAEVVAVCSKTAVITVAALSPEHIVNYMEPDYMERIQSYGKYDLILDAAGLGENHLRKYIPHLKSGGSIVTLRAPLLPNIDKYGLIAGTIKSAVDLAVPNVTSGILKKCGLIKWGFFVPLESAVKEIENLVFQRKIIPIINQMYDFPDLPLAFTKMKEGHIHGKIIVALDKDL